MTTDAPQSVVMRRLIQRRNFITLPLQRLWFDFSKTISDIRVNHPAYHAIPSVTLISPRARISKLKHNGSESENSGEIRRADSPGFPTASWYVNTIALFDVSKTEHCFFSLRLQSSTLEYQSTVRCV